MFTINANLPPTPSVGNATRSGGPVLETTKDDRVFVFFGMPRLLYPLSGQYGSAFTKCTTFWSLS